MQENHETISSQTVTFRSEELGKDQILDNSLVDTSPLL